MDCGYQENSGHQTPWNNGGGQQHCRENREMLEAPLAVPIMDAFFMMSCRTGVPFNPITLPAPLSKPLSSDPVFRQMEFIRNCSADLLPYSWALCDETWEYLSIPFPVLTGWTGGLSSVYLLIPLYSILLPVTLGANGRFVYNHIRRNPAHKTANRLLLSAAVGSVLSSVGIMIMGTDVMWHFVWFILRQGRPYDEDDPSTTTKYDQENKQLATTTLTLGNLSQTTAVEATDICQIKITRLNCDLILSPVCFGIAVFNLSLLLLGLERAAVVRQILPNIRRSNQPPTQHHGDHEQQTTKLDNYWFPDTKEESPQKWKIVVGTLWGSVVSLFFWELTAMSAEERGRELPICMVNIRSLHLFHAIVVLGTIFSAGSFIWTKKVSETELEKFARSQSHISLSYRFNLRYTISLSKILLPTIIFNSVWQTIASTLIIYFNWNLSSVTIDKIPMIALFQHYQMGMFYLPSMVVYAILTSYRLDKFEGRSAKVQRVTDTERLVYYTIKRSSGERQKISGGVNNCSSSSSSKKGDLNKSTKDVVHIHHLSSTNEIDQRFSALNRQWEGR